MGQTRRLYYRLDVAIDVIAMRSPRYRTAAAPANVEGTEPASAPERPDEELTRDELEARAVAAITAEVAPPPPPPDAWSPLDRPRLLDISGSGAQIQARTTELEIGDRVVVAFAFGGRSYRLSTEVMWARRSQFAGATRAGLRFEGMPTTERDVLVREIYRAQRSAARVRRR